jgi:tRNA nucleotidyltransferase (CCA-adding enzyme)
MPWNPNIVSQGELHAMRESAERAWGDDTRHDAYKGHPNPAAGQCYVTSKWLTHRLGGRVGRVNGHYVWVSPDSSHVIDLTGDQFQNNPILYKQASHPLFENLEVLDEQPEDARARRFMTRANQEYDTNSKESKLALDYAGDALPAQEPQAVEDMNNRYWHDEPGYDPGDEEYKFVYGNGQLEVSPSHNHGELADHAGLELGASGPMAMGYINVKLGSAIWEISASNIGAHALTRILKDYAKHVGWKWGGATDAEGEPIGTGSEFGPKGSAAMPFRFVAGELLIGANGARPFDLVKQHLASANGDGEGNLKRSFSGWLEVSDTEARLSSLSLGGSALSKSRHELAEFISTLTDWATDEGLVLLSGNDNVLKTIEDLDRDNIYSPDFNQKERQFFPPSTDDARGPGGMYKCPQCEQLFPTWNLYMKHRQHEEPDGDSPSGFPELDMDATNPTHYTEKKPEVNPVQLANTKQAARVYGKNVPNGQHLVAYAYGCPIGAMSFDKKVTGFKALTPMAKRMLINKFFRIAEASPSDQLDGELPFIYDVKDDHIHVGEPGQRTSQIPGQFTPGGIVEGTYEPGGKVFIRSMTNMPYTVRHMIELWYSTHPELEVKAVHLRDDEGKDTKLAVASPTIQEVDVIPPYGDEDVFGIKDINLRRPFRYHSDTDTVFLGPPGSYHHTLKVPQTGKSMSYKDGYVMLDHPMVHSYGTVPDHVMQAVAQYMGPEFDIDDDRDPWEFQTAMQAPAVGTYIKALAFADPAVDEATKALMGQGGRVFAVGGAVRDAILGKEPHDIDVMVQGLPPDQVRQTLEALPGRVDLTGKDFGVFRYRHNGAEVEIALPRRERSTGVGHQDFDVQTDHTMAPEDDLYRRDFTANAMAVDLGTGELLDPYGGAEDLANGKLSTIHEHSLAEDPLRIVRALVAHSKHGLDPDEATRAQMAGNAESLDHLPPERIQAELDKLFASQDPAKAISLAHKTGILKKILPEVDAAFGYDQNNPHHELELGDHLLSVLRRTAELSDDPDLRMAALLHDIGKPASAWVDPETGGNHYYRNPSTGEGANHEDVGADMAKERLRQLRYPKDRIDRVNDLVQHHMWKAFTTPKGARKFLNRVGDHADDLLFLREADQGGKFYKNDPQQALPDLDQQRQMIDDVRQEAQATQRSQLAINGNDLIEAGVQPGPEIGRILNTLTDRVIEDPTLNNRDTLLQLAQSA